ncbi:hypothetical protein CAPTEDRAFT_209565, partial [Capitella teleta]
MALRNAHQLHKEAFRRLFGSDLSPNNGHGRLIFSRNIRDLHRDSRQHISSEWSLKGLYNQMTHRLNTLAGIFAKQCNVIAAQRMRRAIQIFTHYHKLGYDQEVFKNLVEKIRFGVSPRNRPFYALLGAAAFRWEEKGISKEELQEVASDMDYIDAKAAHSTPTDTAQVIVKESMLDGWEK